MIEICLVHNIEKVQYRSKKLKDGTQTFRLVCRRCNREHQAKWWNSNKECQQGRVRRNRNRLKDISVEHRINNCCIVCGEKNPLVLEFDHLKDKETEISKMCRMGVSPDKLLIEIEKCQILCSNCHQIKSAIEQQSHTYLKLKEMNLFQDEIKKIELLIQDNLQLKHKQYVQKN